MELKKVIETEEGTVEFTGTLEGKELQAVIEVGLNTLLAHGALPFYVDEAENQKVVFPVAKEVQ